MVAAAKQIAIDGLVDPRQEAADLEVEIDDAKLWRDQLYAAMRACVRDLGGYETAAQLLDRRWGVNDAGEVDKENCVSATFLRAALTNTNRNRARIEWLHFFKSQSDDVAKLMASGFKPIKTAEEFARDLEAEMREVLSHKQAEAAIRRARTK